MRALLSALVLAGTHEIQVPFAIPDAPSPVPSPFQVRYGLVKVKAKGSEPKIVEV